VSVSLFPFQDKAVAELTEAIAEWVNAINAAGRPPSDVDGDPIPLLAHLTAITGAGKTPILASVLGVMGTGVALWTTNRSVVVDQTVENLRTKYRHLLPDEATIIGETPSADEWATLMSDTPGLVIWCLTVASWNDTATETKGTGKARLNIHRPAPDWAGETSPWEQLADPTARKRPLWVIYDEGHGQTDVQLDQLLALNPSGIIAASGTPRFSDRIDKYREQLAASATWGPIAAKAMVEVPTTEVSKAGLLKSMVEMIDLNMDNESRVLSVVEQMDLLAGSVADHDLTLRPRALYVTEESNSDKIESRPVVIWKTLTGEGGIAPSAIAVATNTKELPKEAERVSDLSQLRPAHRHIIFNKKFQEGWDDPEAYIAYFDDETKSVTRIKQIIGRIIRQPGLKHFAGAPDLNTAFVFVSSPDEKFDAIVESLRKHLTEEYATDETGEANVGVRKRSERQHPIGLREGLPALSLPNWIIVVPTGMEDLLARLTSAGERPYPPADLEAPGSAIKRTFTLTDAQAQIVRDMNVIGRNIRATNRDYFDECVKRLSDQAHNWLNPALLSGPMFAQSSAAVSPAQKDLARLAAEFVAAYEDRVVYERDVNPLAETWTPGPFSPTRPGTIAYAHAVHPRYPDAKSFMNSQERAMADALDHAGNGWWMRNPPALAQGGYGLPMPVQVTGSNRFFPDFIWWGPKGPWVIDTTGVHLLPAKVRGKLLSLVEPRTALVTKGTVTEDLDTTSDEVGWTLVLSGPLKPRRIHYDSLDKLLTALALE
jgi:type III restriction enzyme